VDKAPSYWRGLIGISDARAVPNVELGCCRYDDPSPWAASSFQPVVVQPGRQAAVILHLLMSNCEYNSGTGTVGYSTIRVHYPDSCPRSAPISGLTSIPVV